MPDGVPAQIRINPVTGLPATSQSFARFGQPSVTIGPGSAFVLGATFSPSFDGVFVPNVAGCTAYGTAASFLQTNLYVECTSSATGVQPYNENGTPNGAPTNSWFMMSMYLLVSGINAHVPLAAVANQLMKIGLFATQTYRMGCQIDPQAPFVSTRMDFNDYASLGIVELR